MKPFMSIKEFAELMGYHRVSIERLIKAGKIPCVRLGKGIRIDFEAFKKQETK